MGHISVINSNSNFNSRMLLPTLKSPTLRLLPTFLLKPNPKKLLCSPPPFTRCITRSLRHQSPPEPITVALTTFLFPAAAALADEGVVGYDPSGGDEFLTNVTGVLYVALVGYFLYRVFGRRAKRFREERLAGSWSQDEAGKRAGEDKVVTVSDSLQGAGIAGLVFIVLGFVAYNVDVRVMELDLPDQYTARNIAVTLRTVVVGVLYLGTFVFGVNFLGLLGLSVQLVLDPSVGLPEDASEGPMVPKRPKGPKVSVTMTPAEVRRAFDKVSKKDEEEEER